MIIVDFEQDIDSSLMKFGFTNTPTRIEFPFSKVNYNTFVILNYSEKLKA